MNLDAHCDLDFLLCPPLLIKLQCKKMLESLFIGYNFFLRLYNDPLIFLVLLAVLVVLAYRVVTNIVLAIVG